jgi:hypothetical protein
VLLSTDGSAYQRLDEAEAASIPEDQGDPAISVLSRMGRLSWSAAPGGVARCRWSPWVMAAAVP